MCPVDLQLFPRILSFFMNKSYVLIHSKYLHSIESGDWIWEKDKDHFFFFESRILLER